MKNSLYVFLFVFFCNLYLCTSFLQLDRIDLPQHFEIHREVQLQAAFLNVVIAVMHVECKARTIRNSFGVITQFAVT